MEKLKVYILVIVMSAFFSLINGMIEIVIKHYDQTVQDTLIGYVVGGIVLGILAKTLLIYLLTRLQKRPLLAYAIVHVIFLGLILLSFLLFGYVNRTHIIVCMVFSEVCMLSASYLSYNDMVKLNNQLKRKQERLSAMKN
jgi:hypothetical protein